MDLTDRFTRVLLGTLTLGAVLVPATVAAADPPGGPGDLTTPTTDPDPDPDPQPECPPFVATCDELTSDPCEPIEQDCGDDPEPCPQDADCPAPEEDPDPEDEPVDEPVPADPNFTG